MIGREDLERALWNAAGILREVFGSHDYKNYLFRLLLLKRLSDVLGEEAEGVERKTTSHDLTWNESYRHRFFIPENFRWSYLQHLNKYDVGRGLNQVAKAIETTNPELEGIFTSIDFGDNPNLVGIRQHESVSYHLLRLIHHFSFLNLRNSNLAKDALGEACEYLMEKSAADAGKKGGEFYTPSQVRELLVQLLEPQENMSICDPVCGSGSLLVECVRQIKGQRDTPHNLLLYGQEKNYETWAIAKINLLLHDIFEFDIRLGDVINDPQLIKAGKLMQFDRVIANLPFNLKNWSYETTKFRVFDERFRYGISPQSSGDFAFIQHILSTLNNTGKAVVIVPLGVLFRGGSEGKIRRGIIEDDFIEAVVGLPSNLLYGIGIPIAILVFNRNKSTNRKKRVLFIDASKEFQGKNRSQNYLSVPGINHIVNVYQDFRNEQEYSKVVSLEEIAANDYTLNISRYVIPTEIAINFDIEINKLGNKLLNLETKIAEAESEIDECLRELGVEIS